MRGLNQYFLECHSFLEMKIYNKQIIICNGVRLDKMCWPTFRLVEGLLQSLLSPLDRPFFLRLFFFVISSEDVPCSAGSSAGSSAVLEIVRKYWVVKRGEDNERSCSSAISGPGNILQLLTQVQVFLSLLVPSLVYLYVSFSCYTRLCLTACIQVPPRKKIILPS